MVTDWKTTTNPQVIFTHIYPIRGSSGDWPKIHFLTNWLDRTRLIPNRELFSTNLSNGLWVDRRVQFPGSLPLIKGFCNSFARFSIGPTCIAMLIDPGKIGVIQVGWIPRAEMVLLRAAVSRLKPKALSRSRNIAMGFR